MAAIVYGEDGNDKITGGKSSDTFMIVNSREDPMKLISAATTK